MADINEGSVEANHLCVMVHGLWGNPNHMQSVAKSLRAQYPADKLYLLVAKSNSGYFTYDGIETGGERVCREIEDTIADIASRGGHISRLSVIGYSLGGLVSRYAVGLLHAQGALDKLECVNFCAFASPFLGARSPVRGWLFSFFNVMGAHTLNTSGQQMFGIDTFRDTGRPLLSVMADPDSVFMAGLARFQRRTLYANIQHDRTAAYYTTAIAKTDPFAAEVSAGGEIGDMPLRFVPGCGEIIMDPHEPIDSRERRASFRKQRRENIRRAPKTLRTRLSDMAPMAAVISLLPLAFTLYVSMAIYQTLLSRRRQLLHVTKGLDAPYKGLPLWLREGVEAAEGAYEDVFERVAATHSPAYLTEQEQTQEEAQSLLARQKASVSRGAARCRKQNGGGADDEEVAVTEDEGDSDYPVLALTKDQFAMIDALDSLGWRKYRVWFHNVRHSHAAIVIRWETPRFAEGKTVLRHFSTAEFLI